jgi:UDP-N-acetyl-D-galactosamine dehydrogenase
MKTMDKAKIAIIGLGYVGLPLAIEFKKKYSVVGFDIDQIRIAQLKAGIDVTNEIEFSDLKEAKSRLRFSSDEGDLAECTVFIVTVPTPIDELKNPNLSPLVSASQTIAKFLKVGDVVIYESTVYPGCTEEVCVPILEEISRLRFNVDFFCGYSPERINPGDKVRRLNSIIKITSGSTTECANFVDALYREIISAGTYKVESIRIAEAAKVIENIQRDVNIALVNELAIIFNLLGINTEAVLKAAETKWNFVPYRPGLVGGHCIGIDPYYLKHKALSTGYHPEIISAVRRLNDGMGHYVVTQFLKALAKKNIQLNDARVLIMGLSFKENCPDLRNTRVSDIIFELKEFGMKVDIHDPWVLKEEAESDYGITLIDKINHNIYDGIILAVAHSQYRQMKIDELKSYAKKNSVIYDLKYIFPLKDSDVRL